MMLQARRRGQDPKERWLSREKPGYRSPAMTGGAPGQPGGNHPESRCAYGLLLMGLDLTLQALPADCPLLERSRTDPEVAELLPFLPRALLRVSEGQPWRPWPLSEDESRFLVELRQLLAADAGLPRRHLELQRRWDMLCYLLSPRRRAGDFEPRDEGLTAVRGMDRVGPEVRASQGVPLYWNPPEQVRRLASWLSGLAHEEVARHWHPEAMEAEATYQTFAGPDSDGELPLVLEDFERLRLFYTDAAGLGYGALVILD